MDQPKWESFEDEVAEYLKRELQKGNLGIPRKARFLHPAEYFAHDSKKMVKFEIAIEQYAPDGPKPIMHWIWECKHYPGRLVPVGEVREFARLIDSLQLPVKGTMVTTDGYQEGAGNVANTSSIAIWTFQKRVHYRQGLHGPNPPVDYVDIEVITRKGAKPVSLAELVWKECFGKKPPPRRQGGREIMEIG